MGPVKTGKTQTKKDWRREFIRNFFKKAGITVTIEKSPAVEVKCEKDVIIIDVKNPLALMGLGLDLKILQRKENENSVIRKAIKDMGFRIKLRYKFFEIDL